MGINISLQEDYMLIHGRPQALAATVLSHGDHRIVMACAILALKAKGSVTIEQAEAVNKSYPNFFEQLEAICIP
jgi:3-phosphoshikimate 1-carboxyvinyltransferase